MTAPAYTICLPYRAESPERRAIFHWTYARWRALCPDAEIVTGGDDCTGTPNRAKMRNACVAKASTDTLLIFDCDCFLDDAQQVQEILALIPRAGVVQYDSLRLFNGPDDTDAVLAQHPARTIALPSFKLYNRFPGLLYGVTRQAWLAVGGCDERFTGWGFEDTALQKALTTIVGPRLTISAPANHLWHPHTDPHEMATGNRDLYARYEAANGNRDAMLHVVQVDPRRVSVPAFKDKIYTSSQAFRFWKAGADIFVMPQGFHGPVPSWVQAQDYFSVAMRAGIICEVTE